MINSSIKRYSRASRSCDACGQGDKLDLVWNCVMLAPVISLLVQTVWVWQEICNFQFSFQRNLDDDDDGRLACSPPRVSQFFVKRRRSLYSATMPSLGAFGWNIRVMMMILMMMVKHIYRCTLRNFTEPMPIEKILIRHCHYFPSLTFDRNKKQRCDRFIS